MFNVFTVVGAVDIYVPNLFSWFLVLYKNYCRKNSVNDYRQNDFLEQRWWGWEACMFLNVFFRASVCTRKVV